MKRAEGIRYLTHDREGYYTGHLRTFSTFGSTVEDCAPVAWRYAYVLSRESCEPAVDHITLDLAMSAVVNDHPDVRSIIREYGHRQYT